MAMSNEEMQCDVLKSSKNDVVKSLSRFEED